MNFGHPHRTLASRALVTLAAIGISGCTLPRFGPDRPPVAVRVESPAAATEPNPELAPRVADEATSRAAGTASAARGTSPEEDASGDRPSNAVAAEPRADLWARIRDRQTLTPVALEKITRELAWFRKNQAYLDRVSARARPYLGYLLDEIEKRGMPGEIALIPFIESGFQPFAYSAEQAAGIWQFIPSTARYWGLRSNWWYDGRRDIVESTRAALDYLERLNRDLSGDWLLTMAAYNSGEGKVLRAMTRNRRAGRPADFWAVRDQLPRETRAYIPRLLALARIVAEPSRFGLTLAPIPAGPYFDVVDIGGQLDLAVAADMAAISMDELYRLNPAFNQWATSPDGPHRLLIPVQNSDRFRSNLARLPPSARIKWIRHVIRRGETLGGISRRYRTRIEVLRQANNLSGDRIRAGRALMVPRAARPLESYALRAPVRRTASRGRTARGRGGRATYVVRRGDSLWTIARRFRLSIKKLTAWNGLSRSAVLRPGQKLAIRKLGARPRTVAVSLPRDQRTRWKRDREIRYTVRRGDSLWRISRRFRVTVASLRKWNGLARGRYLRPGQQLTVRVAGGGQVESI